MCDEMQPVELDEEPIDGFESEDELRRRLPTTKPISDDDVSDAARARLSHTRRGLRERLAVTSFPPCNVCGLRHYQPKNGPHLNQYDEEHRQTARLVEEHSRLRALCAFGGPGLFTPDKR